MQYMKASLGSDLSALGTPCIYDAEAIYALRESERRHVLGTPMASDFTQAMVEAELRLARGCAVVLAVNDIERDRFERSGAASVYVVGHAVDAAPTPAPRRSRGWLDACAGYSTTRTGSRACGVEISSGRASGNPPATRVPGNVSRALL